MKLYVCVKKKTENILKRVYFLSLRYYVDTVPGNVQKLFILCLYPDCTLTFDGGGRWGPREVSRTSQDYWDALHEYVLLTTVTSVSQQPAVQSVTTWCLRQKTYESLKVLEILHRTSRHQEYLGSSTEHYPKNIQV